MTKRSVNLAEAIRNALEHLRHRCPVFHREAEFRGELVELLEDEKFRVREEVPMARKEGNWCIDIVIGGEVAIELKYLPVKLSVVWKGEEYNRNNYDSRKNPVSVGNDIWRLQELVDDQSSKIQRGFVIVVTNSNLLRKEPHDWREWHKFSERTSDHFYYAVISVMPSDE